MNRLRLLGLAIVAALLLPGLAAMAATPVRWAGEADAASLDPYTRDESLQLALLANVYEPLVRHAADLSLEPALAIAWERTAPTVWRFHLRPGVRWQDGSPFTADDVIFSLDRAKGPASLLRAPVAHIRSAQRVDDLTVDLETSAPDPILPKEVASWYIMSRAWAEANGAAQPALLGSRQENYATRHAMGTGPYRLMVREPDQRTVFERNPLWWDKAPDMPEQVEYLVIANPTARVAALVSGEVDLITDIPPQDADFVARTPDVRLLQRPELRTVLLGMDESRGTLPKSDVTAANPLRDVRVREAMALAIDETAIASKIMRGHARPTWLLWAPEVEGYDPTLDQRPPADPARARALLAEAGYPGGFRLGLDCPNDRYVMDEAICTAVAAMLGRIGIRVDLNIQPKARFFAEIGPPDFRSSFFLIGWSPPTADAANVLWNLAMTRRGDQGLINFGGYSSPAIDALMPRIGEEPDPVRRRALIREAAILLQKDIAYIPLHQQMLLWGVKKSIELPQPADGAVMLWRLRRR